MIRETPFGWLTAPIGFGSLIFLLELSPVWAQGAPPTPDRYVISVGDELELDILDDNESPQRFVVGRDGEVQLPFIGGMPVATSTIADAREAVRRAYIERQIFVDPEVELSIASFRPISVLGDVRRPGNYDFQPFMTAEQAVGLAGGVAVSVSNEEARVLERRNLEGTLGRLDFDLALAAAKLARVNAQLAGKQEMAFEDVPAELRPFIDRMLFDEHKAGEDQIITLDAGDRARRRALLQDAVEEAEKRVEYLSQRETLHTEQVARYTAELERARTLLERGLVPRSGLNEAEQQAAQAESDRLYLREQRSAAIVQAASLRSDLVRINTDWERSLRQEAQSLLNEIKKIVSERSSIEERMELLSLWTSAAAGMDTDVLIDYRVRRRSETGVTTQRTEAYDELLPGDMLVIAIKPPEALSASE